MLPKPSTYAYRLFGEYATGHRRKLHWNSIRQGSSVHSFGKPYATIHMGQALPSQAWKRSTDRCSAYLCFRMAHALILNEHASKVKSAFLCKVATTYECTVYTYCSILSLFACLHHVYVFVCMSVCMYVCLSLCMYVCTNYVFCTLCNVHVCMYVNAIFLFRTYSTR